MNLNKAAQVLLDRYMLAVRRALTGKQREDIALEIRSFLLDNLEESYPGTDEISESQVKQAFEKLGSPRKLATQFCESRYLIGPRFYPIYIFVLKIVVSVVVGALTLALIIRALSGEIEAGLLPVMEYLGTLWNGAFLAAASITLVFAILERVNEGKDLEELAELEKFDLNDLPDLSEIEKEPTFASMVFEIVVGVLGLAFFTYIYNSGGRLPLFGAEGDSLTQARLFTDGFMRFVPFMMAVTGLEVSRSATQLTQGHQTSLTVWWDIATKAANFVLAILLLGAFPLLSTAGLQALLFTAGWDFTRVNSGVDTGLRVILILSLVGMTVEIIKTLIREIRNPAG